MIVLLVPFMFLHVSAADLLVESLGSDDIGVRDRATTSLKSLGKRASAALQRASRSSDTEVRMRAASLLKPLPVERLVTKAFPLSNSNPEQVARNLKDLFQGWEGLEVACDARSRSVIVRTANADQEDAVDKAISALDWDPLENPVYVFRFCCSAEEIRCRLQELWGAIDRDGQR